MGTVNLKQARQRLGDLVDAAERGESTVITRRGRSVARLDPVASKTSGHLPDLSEFRASLKTSGKGLTEAVLAQRQRERY